MKSLDQMKTLGWNGGEDKGFNVAPVEDRP